MTFSDAFLGSNDSEIESFYGSVSDESFTIGLGNEEGENFEFLIANNLV